MLCVFDLDGTVADIGPYYETFVRTTPKNWTAFKLHIPFDVPIPATIYLWRLLQSQPENTIVISTARGEECRDASIEWLERHGLSYAKLYMRDLEYRGDDVVVKLENAKKIENEFGKIDMIFDDRKKVVDAYTSAGYYVFDVAQGKGHF